MARRPDSPFNPPVPRPPKPPKARVLCEFDAERAAKILDRIAEGEPVLDSIRAENLDPRMWYRWCAQVEGLGTAHRAAREMAAEALFDELAELEDDVLEGRVDPNAGRIVIWSRMYRLSRMCPKHYHEKVTHDVNAEIVVKRIILEPGGAAPQPEEVES